MFDCSQYPVFENGEFLPAHASINDEVTRRKKQNHGSRTLSPWRGNPFLHGAAWPLDLVGGFFRRAVAFREQGHVWTPAGQEAAGSRDLYPEDVRINWGSLGEHLKGSTADLRSAQLQGAELGGFI